MEFKKYAFMILTLITIGTKVFVFGGTSQTVPVYKEMSQENLVELYNKAGLDSPDIIINTLIELGVSKKELVNLLGEGKKVYNIIQDKSITQNDFQKALSNQYKCKIKESVKNKTITRRESRRLNKLLRERMKSWETIE